MYRTWLETFELPSAADDILFTVGLRETCYNGLYPFGLFPDKELCEISCSPVTIFYGRNGCGKTTLLNVIAEKTGAERHSEFNGSGLFPQYVEMCRMRMKRRPETCQILTSDDVFDYVLNMRTLNAGIDMRREELFEEYYEKKNSHVKLTSMQDYEAYKESQTAKRRTKSRYTRERLPEPVTMHSNGENAMRYFIEKIGENGLYLLDEPENSLSVTKQLELASFLYDSARHFGCQFLIATHSPILLSMKDALIYDLDETPVTTRKWTELENVRTWFRFFEAHREEFLKQGPENDPTQ